MFTLPPLPPKDYILRDVLQNTRSHPDHTPSALPRITQTTVGKFCAPIQYQEHEKIANLDIDFKVNPQVLDRWTDHARAFWVDEPGKNAKFLHDMFQKYSVQMPSYDARYKHSEKVFYRSFKYELDCVEEERLQKLYRKMEREENEEREKINKIIEEKIAKTDTSMGIKSCKLDAPFWWKSGEEKIVEKLPPIPKPVDSTTYEEMNLRWQEEPNLLKSAIESDPCKRREELALVGMPFRNQACNWYYRNYPPPNLRFIAKRFA